LAPHRALHSFPTRRSSDLGKHGSIENIEYGDLPDPVLQPGHAIVRVRAAALNHLDLWVLKGWPGLEIALPHIGGADISGEIAEVDLKSTRLNSSHVKISYA